MQTDPTTGKEAYSHRLPSYLAALNVLTKSEDDFSQNIKNKECSIIGSVVGFVGYATTVPTELLINLNQENQEQARSANRERETADYLKSKYLMA